MYSVNPLVSTMSMRPINKSAAMVAGQSGCVDGYEGVEVEELVQARAKLLGTICSKRYALGLNRKRYSGKTLKASLEANKKLWQKRIGEGEYENLVSMYSNLEEMERIIGLDSGRKINAMSRKVIGEMQNVFESKYGPANWDDARQELIGVGGISFSSWAQEQRDGKQ